MDPIRLCFLRMSDGIELPASVKENVILSRKPRFKGFFENFMNNFLDIFFLPHFNFTIQGSDKMGVQNANGSFDGCNGKIQRGEADAGLYLYYYPSYDETIDVSQITDERTLNILSVYNVTKEGRYLSILESFYSLSPPVWLTFFFFAFILGHTIQRLTPRLRKRWTIDVILYHLLRQSPFPGGKWFPRCLSIQFSCLIFFTSVIYICLIKTEIVVVEQPSLVNNYGDIIARLDRSTPRFEPRIDEFYDFKHATIGTKEKMIWDRIQNRNFHSSTDILKRMFELLSGESIELHDSESGKITLAVFCAVKVHQVFIDQFKGAFPWLSKDPSSRKIQYGYVLRKGVSQSFKNSLLKKGIRMTEHGLYILLTKQITSETKLSEGQSRSQYRMCVSGKLQMPEVGYHAFSMQNFRRLVYYVTFSLYLTWVVLAIEFYCRRKRSFLRKKVVRV